MGYYSDLMEFYSDLMDDKWDVPSGNDYITVRCGKAPFLMGKSTISTWPFSIAMLNHQSVTRDGDLGRKESAEFKKNHCFGRKMKMWIFFLKRMLMKFG